jgi:hypothetical protein
MRLSDRQIIEIIDAHSDEELECLMGEFYYEHGREPYGYHELTRWLMDRLRHAPIFALPDHLDIVDGKIVPKQRDEAAA